MMMPSATLLSAGFIAIATYPKLIDFLRISKSNTSKSLLMGLVSLLGEVPTGELPLSARETRWDLLINNIVSMAGQLQ